jgi:Lar family restriction alleviation protein
MILPCPFCGEKAKLHETLSIDWKPLYIIQCLGKELTTGTYHYKKKSAIKSWNTRK